jgi:hypothetical protein
VITIEGEQVRARAAEGVEAEMTVAKFVDGLRSDHPDGRGLVWPEGTQCLEPTAAGFMLVHQSPPGLQGLRWIAPDSPNDFGPGTQYRDVRVALPYMIVIALFERTRRGRVQLSGRNECFFSLRPLGLSGMDTPLLFPALLNCSRFPAGRGHPLSWICTQHLPREEYALRPTLARAVHDGLDALLRHLLGGGFNLSSEHHELSSWFTETVKAGVDPRLASIEAWEAASAEDPHFVFDVPWLETGKTLVDVISHVREHHGRGGTVSCANDLARIVMNQRRSTRRAT